MSPMTSEEDIDDVLMALNSFVPDQKRKSIAT